MSTTQSSNRVKGAWLQKKVSFVQLHIIPPIQNDIVATAFHFNSIKVKFLFRKLNPNGTQQLVSIMTAT